MLNKLGLNKSPYWAYIPFVLCAVSLFFSRFLLSVSVGLMLVYVVWYMVKSKDKLFAPQSNNTKNVYRLLIFWVILVFVDGLRAGNLESWFSEVALKLPLVVVPLIRSYFAQMKSSCQYQNQLAHVCTLLTTWP